MIASPMPGQRPHQRGPHFNGLFGCIRILRGFDRDARAEDDIAHPWMCIIEFEMILVLFR